MLWARKLQLLSSCIVAQHGRAWAFLRVRCETITVCSAVVLKPEEEKAAAAVVAAAAAVEEQMAVDVYLKRR